MKVIDLLNKIANGEEVPNHIRYDGIDLYYNKKNNCYDLIMSNVIEEFYTFSYSDLNNKVEILEEPKGIPKRIQSNGENLYSEYIGQWLINKENYTEYDELLMNKINEILDYLESKGESND